MDIEVAYANPEQQVIISLRMPEGSTIEQAIETSGILKRFPEIDRSALNVGIFASACGLDQLLKPADRIEIYRPLHHDPKQARRQRARKK
ncbi:MAG: RnfH family protein [Methylococcaceae bacterium]